MKKVELTISKNESIKICYDITELTGNYGIIIRTFSKNALLDEVIVQNITASKERIMSIQDLLVRNTVTPCTLRDILDDIL